ncbi:MAG TPA: SDR family oxidoreductase [Pyrinomonadaceae bacterium]|jgi:NAD(P)-dependent dehydrogenase (short-subunit alcohol dehydrogenase family)
MKDSNGRNYLITGSTGIAAETARQAAQFGANIFIVSNDEESCAALVSELKETTESGYAVADLTIESETQAAMEKFAGEFGRLDALFNVVGISGRKFGDGPLHECTLAGWNATFDANARTVFLMCRAALKVMLEQAPDRSDVRGAILNMGSVLNFSPEPKYFATHAYAATKAAIVGLSKTAAAYYAPHKIRINVIAPSLVKTPMSARAQTDQTILDFMRAKHPFGEEMLDAADVARLALFLMGDDARRITGETFKIDAGWSVSNV